MLVKDESNVSIYLGESWEQFHLLQSEMSAERAISHVWGCTDTCTTRAQRKGPQ